MHPETKRSSLELLGNELFACACISIAEWMPLGPVVPVAPVRWVWWPIAYLLLVMMFHNSGLSELPRLLLLRRVCCVLLWQAFCYYCTECLVAANESSSGRRRYLCLRPRGLQRGS